MAVYLSLYSKYRPQKFSDVINQEAIKETLIGAIKFNRVSHAYLFAGTRGTGKTSIARIFSKAINCLEANAGEPCNKCLNCDTINSGRSLDLIEIDAASNRGIDEIRELRESVKLAAAHLKFKVYIIDEVHMLTREAFNALLKTLEEPPPHVIFILATTELHKVPLTIISRCQHFNFKKIDGPAIADHLRSVSNKEKIVLTDAGAALIARLADGSMRDAISILDQISTGVKNEITPEIIHSFLGLPSYEAATNILENIIKGNLKQVLEDANEIANSGQNINHLLRQILETIEEGIDQKIKGGKHLLGSLSIDELTNLLDIFLQSEQLIKMAENPLLPLELSFFEAEKILRNQNNKSKIIDTTLTQNILPPPTLQASTDWDGFLEYVKKNQISLYTLLISATLLEHTSNAIMLGFVGRFYKERLDNQKTILSLEGLAEKYFGQKIKISGKLIEKKNIVLTSNQIAQKFSGDIING